MKKKCILIFLTSVLSMALNAQYCGGGLFNMTIDATKKNTKSKFTYELMRVDKDSLQKYAPQLPVGGTGVIVTEDLLTKVLMTASKNHETRESKLYGIPMSGTFEKTFSCLQRELTNDPMIMKLSTKDKTLYILNNFFGGCGEDVLLIWTRKEVKLSGIYYRKKNSRQNL